MKMVTLQESQDTLKELSKLNKDIDECKSYQIWKSIFPWQENCPRLR